MEITNGIMKQLDNNLYVKYVRYGSCLYCYIEKNQSSTINSILFCNVFL